MIVKAEKKEIDVIQETCVLANLQANFYTIETNPLMVQVEILELNGEELSAKDAWLVGRTVVWSLLNHELK